MKLFSFYVAYEEILMIRRIAALSAVAFIGMGMAACADIPDETTDDVEEGTWRGEGHEHVTLTRGQLRGTDGCNGLGGRYVVEGDTVTFSLGFSTMKACPGVDTWLRTISSATVSGDTMTVFDRDGEEIGTLTRSA